MAIAKEIWEQIKADYEVGIFREDTIFSELSRKYKVDRSTISKKAKSKEWEYGKNSHISRQESASVRELSKVVEEKSHLNHTEITAVEAKTKQLLEKDNINSNTMLIINALQARLLNAVDTMVIDDLKPKEITSAVKDIHDINNPREANVINNTNAQQNNDNKNIEITFK